MLITLYRKDSADRLRYYAIDDRQGHLFSSHAFSVTWGSSLAMGKERHFVFETRAEMDRRLRKLVQTRIADGYRVLYSYFRPDEYADLRPTLRRAAAS